MSSSNAPTKEDLPTKGKLIKSTLLAAIAAGIILVTIVMPAEFGMDPTGFGKFIGLKDMGAIKTEQSNEQTANDTSPVQNGSTQTHKKTITLAPDEWAEIKLVMRENDKAAFMWFTQSGTIYVDTHADSKEQKIDYHQYYEGNKQNDAGILTASFGGHHGWYWRNKTKNPITITLHTNGGYQDIIIYRNKG